MKRLQKIFALILAVAVVLSFASCKKKEEIKLVETLPTTSQKTEESGTAPTETEPSTEEEATTETTTESTTEPNTKKNPPKKTTTTRKQTTTTTTTTTKPAPSNSIVGKWTTTEQATIAEITGEPSLSDYSTPLKVQSTQCFNSDGTYLATEKILNYNEFNAELRRMYIDIGKAQAAEEGVEFTPEMQKEFELIADSDMKEIEIEMTAGASGTYKVEGNKIIYVGEDYYETFTLNGNTLTLTGSSIPDTEGFYPVVLHRA